MTSKDTSQLFEKLSDYVALVGRGQKSGKTLNQAQARHIMLAMLQEKTLPEQTGALLMLLRMREETDEELAGFVQACRDTLPNTINNLPNVDIDLGCYAGKRRHLPWFVLSGLCLATNGYTVLLHGLEEHDSNRLYLDQVFRDLSWPIAANVDETKQQLLDYSFSYISLQHLHPSMTKLLQLRHILGLRSCMHSVAKMLNPAGAKASIHGVYHRELDDTHIQVARLLHETRIACIRGDSGEVEATPEKPFTMNYMDAESKAKKYEFPIYLSSWSHQTRQLGSQALKELWCGQLDNKYGEAATISTLAVYLSALHGHDACDALAKAADMWHSRSKVWPLS
jgi:anthranilate phosphoribosyltransferase